MRVRDAGTTREKRCGCLVETFGDFQRGGARSQITSPRSEESEENRLQSNRMWTTAEGRVETELQRGGKRTVVLSLHAVKKTGVEPLKTSDCRYTYQLVAEKKACKKKGPLFPKETPIELPGRTTGWKDLPISKARAGIRRKAGRMISHQQQPD